MNAEESERGIATKPDKYRITVFLFHEKKNNTYDGHLCGQIKSTYEREMKQKKESRIGICSRTRSSEMNRNEEHCKRDGKEFKKQNIVFVLYFFLNLKKINK